jgi:hypothetical protein
LGHAVDFAFPHIKTTLEGNIGDYPPGKDNTLPTRPAEEKIINFHSTVLLHAYLG